MSRQSFQLRPLIRVFFGRFFENEVAGSGDLRALFFWLLSFLAAPGLIAPAFLGLRWSGNRALWDKPEGWGWAAIARRQGLDALRAASLDDKTFYLGFAMAASALVALVVWQSLVPDRRDAQVLGPLPVRPAAVVRARLMALTAFIAIVAVGTHTLAAISFGTFLAAGNTVGFALKGMLAHFIASVSACVFVFLAMVVTQGLVLVAGGPRALARVSPIVQATLVAAMVFGLLSLPAMSDRAAAAVRSTTTPFWLFATPPLWFLGLYEWILGTSDPILARLAAIAVVATTMTAALVWAIYPLAYARLELAELSHPTRYRPTRGALGSRAVTAVLARDSRIRAVIQFAVTTLARSDRHRLVFATAIGLSAAWIGLGWIALQSTSWRVPPVRFFAIPFGVEWFLLIGLRIALSLPADTSPAWMFDLSTPTRRHVHSAIERAMAMVATLPVLCSTILVWRWWGTGAAVWHTAFAAASVGALIQALLRNFDGIPCARVFTPERAKLDQRWPFYLAGFVLFTTMLGGLDAMIVWTIVTPQSAGAAIGIPRAVGAIALLMTTALAFALRHRSLTSVLVQDGDDVAMLTTALRQASNRPMDVHAGSTSRDVSSILGAETASWHAREDRWFDGFSVRPGEMWHDCRFALRRLRKAPAFALFAIVTLAVGIGATTAVYSVMHALTSRPLKVRDPQNVVTIAPSLPTTGVSLSWSDFQDLRRQQTAFTSLEASSDFPASLNISGTASMVTGQLVTGGYFPMLGVDVLAGRVIQPADDDPGAQAVVVLSESIWRTRFASDPRAIGTFIRIGGEPYQIAGVLSPSFRGMDARIGQAAFWVALSHAPLTDPALTAFRTRPGSAYLRVVARLKANASRARARQEVSAIGARLDAASPLPRLRGRDGTDRDRPRAWTASPIAEGTLTSPLGETIAFLVVLLPALVLLIACTNLANLVLSRGASRRNELAVRRALGASRWALIRGQLVEHMLLAFFGGLAGVGLAYVLVTRAMSYAQTALGSVPQTQIDARLDPAALAVACAACAVAVIVAGFGPALGLTRAGLNDLHLSDLSSTMSARWRGRRYLVAMQVAASVSLLLIAALCVRAVLGFTSQRDTEVDANRIAVVTVDFGLRTHDLGRLLETADRIFIEAGQSPGLRGVALEASFPPGQRHEKDRPALASVSSDAFRVLGLSMRSGRTFTREENVPGGPPVVVISESAARAAFGSTDVVGRRFEIAPLGNANEAYYTPAFSGLIVGVVSDAGRHPDSHEGLRTVYRPFAQTARIDAGFVLAPPVQFIARSASEEIGGAVTSLTTAIRRVDPDLPVRFAGSMDLLLGGPLAIMAAVVRGVTALALIALALSMSGLYSVLSHLVANRTREMGIRVALGADRASIVQLVLKDGVRPVVLGTAIGLVLATIVRMAMQPQLPARVAFVDWTAVVMAIVPLVIAAAVACYLPARRAASINPNEALRHL